MSARASRRVSLRSLQALVAAAVLLAILHAADAGLLVAAEGPENLGEGGPAIGCVFLTTRGLVQVGYFHDPEPAASRSWPAPRAACPPACLLVERLWPGGGPHRAIGRCRFEAACPHDWCRETG